MTPILHRTHPCAGGDKPDLQRVFLTDGTLRVMTPSGAVEIHVDRGSDTATDNIEAGPGVVVDFMSPYPATYMVAAGPAHLRVRMMADEGEPSEGQHTLLPPMTTDEATLEIVRETLLEIVRDDTVPAKAAMLVNVAIGAIHGDAN